jgi:hypothetical protein
VIGWGARTHRAACRSRPFEAGGSLTWEVRGRVGAASTTPGRAGTARRPGSGKQGGEAYGCRNQWWNPLKTLDRLGPGGCGLGWQRAGAFYNRRRRPRRRDGDVGGHGERLRRSRGQACRGKLGADTANRSIVTWEPGCGRLPARRPDGQRQGTPSADGPIPGRSRRSSPRSGKPTAWRRPTAGPHARDWKARRTCRRP